MRHMGNSGRIAVAAAFAAAGLLVLTAITLEETVLFACLGVLAAVYLASVVQVVARGRNLALLAGGVGTSLFIGFTIAFLRMWGLAFNQDPAALGTAVTSQDSDIYFYLAALSGAGTLLVLFVGAVWPGRRLRTQSRNQAPARRPAPGRVAPRGTKTRTPSRPAPPATYGRPPASRSGATRASSAKRPVPPASSVNPAGKSIPKPAVKPPPASPAKAASRR